MSSYALTSCILRFIQPMTTVLTFREKAQDSSFLFFLSWFISFFDQGPQWMIHNLYCCHRPALERRGFEPTTNRSRMRLLPSKRISHGRLSIIKDQAPRGATSGRPIDIIIYIYTWWRRWRCEEVLKGRLGQRNRYWFYRNWAIRIATRLEP